MKYGSRGEWGDDTYNRVLSATHVPGNTSVQNSFFFRIMTVQLLQSNLTLA